jgi:urease accessory protein
VKGHLHLSCSVGANGESYLREQSFRAPLHLSKPHFDAGSLVLNIVNPTAGIFDDDEIELDLVVEEGARLVLSTPSSSRIYRSRKGGPAKVRQSIKIGAGSFVEYYPEPFIPHAGARFQQHNDLCIAEGGSMLYFEWLTPGRVASGEVFLYDELQWDTDVRLDKKLIIRECYTLRPDDFSLHGIRTAFDAAHYLSCIVVGDFPFPQDAIEGLGNDAVYLGCGPLCTGGWTIKALCLDSVHARRTMVALREVLYLSMGRERPHLGRF